MKAWTQQQREMQRNCNSCVIRTVVGSIGIFVVALCMYELHSLRKAAESQDQAPLFGEPHSYVLSREERRKRAHFRDERRHKHGKHRGTITHNDPVEYSYTAEEKLEKDAREALIAKREARLREREAQIAEREAELKQTW